MAKDTRNISKTKTGALSKSAGFPGTDRVSAGSWIDRKMKEIKEKDDRKLEKLFWAEQLRQSDKSHEQDHH